MCGYNPSAEPPARVVPIRSSNLSQSRLTSGNAIRADLLGIPETRHVSHD